MKRVQLSKVKYWANDHQTLKTSVRKVVVLYRKTKAYPKTKEMYQRVNSEVLSTDDQAEIVWYFCDAVHPNLGDLAQRFCIENWLKENLSNHVVCEIPTKVFLAFQRPMMETLKHKIKKDDIIIFQSGYTMSDLHPDDRVREPILDAFQDNRILIFPQTILYNDQKKCQEMGKKLAACSRLLLLARDQKSYDFAKEAFPYVNIELYPDIVTTQIGLRDFSGFLRSGIGLCVRDDGEKFYSFEEIEDLRQKLSSLDKVEVTDTDDKNLKTINSDTIRQAVLKKITDFAEKRVIVTDRYHGTIFSLAAGTPVIVIKTRDHKVSTGVQWFKGIYDKNAYYCENIEDVPALVEEILSTHTYAPLLPYFKQEYYDRLSQKFLGDDFADEKAELKEETNRICPVCSCTGCMACLNVCPHGAITMGSDERGFYVPVIDAEKCTDCGVCRNICPSAGQIVKNAEPDKVYAMWSKNPALRKKSSSGGVFSGLANHILDQGGVVFGCTLNKEHVAEHICIETPEALAKLRGSKYVQSRIGECYKDVKKYMKEGRTVLFTGTPCQIAGLYAVLGAADRTNLYTMDIVCHGAPSPKAFKDYITASEKKVGARAKDIFFRYKKPSWTTFSMRIRYDNGEVYQAIGREDPYVNAFLKDCLTRECCHSCKYASTRRMADLTAADFWSYVSYSKALKNDEKGISLVLVNNEKGRQLFEAIRKDYVVQERTVTDAKRGNRCLSRPYQASPARDSFWKTYLETGDFMKASAECVPHRKPSMKHRISEEINRNYYLLPGFAKKNLQKIYKKK